MLSLEFCSATAKKVSAVRIKSIRDAISHFSDHSVHTAIAIGHIAAEECQFDSDEVGRQINPNKHNHPLPTERPITCVGVVQG